MEKIELVTIRMFLHGFLGQPNDWLSQDILPCSDQFFILGKNIAMTDLVSESFKSTKKNHIIDFAIDYVELFPTDIDIKTWAKLFTNWYLDFKIQLLQKLSLSLGNDCQIQFQLIGYSLGGRLALACLGEDKNAFNHWIFISTNPGLMSDVEKRNRFESDKKWAEAFLNQTWSLLMHEWNNQAVFQFDGFIERNESNYNRKKLSDQLLNWSLANQDHCENLIIANKDSIQWYVGEKDVKFRSIAENLQNKNSEFKFKSVSDRGHRCFFAKT